MSEDRIVGSSTVHGDAREALVPAVRPQSQSGENIMTTTRSFVISLIGMFAVLFVASVATRAQSGYTGFVTASQIASTGSGIGIWQKKLNCHDEADCAQRLVAAGGKYVLVTSKGVFQLSDQKKAALYAGHSVTVNGVFDTQKKSIEVADMQLYNSTTTSAGVQ
jgi:hypothetical protein